MVVNPWGLKIRSREHQHRQVGRGPCWWYLTPWCTFQFRKSLLIQDLTHHPGRWIENLCHGPAQPARSRGSGRCSGKSKSFLHSRDPNTDLLTPEPCSNHCTTLPHPLTIQACMQWGLLALLRHQSVLQGLFFSDGGSGQGLSSLKVFAVGVPTTWNSTPYISISLSFLLCRSLLKCQLIHFLSEIFSYHPPMPIPFHFPSLHESVFICILSVSFLWEYSWALRVCHVHYSIPSVEVRSWLFL